MAELQPMLTFMPTEEQTLAKRADLGVPELSFGGHAENLPDIAMAFFRELWSLNGYAAIRSAHEDMIALPPAGHQPPIVLVNTYRGLSDGEVKDRKPWLKEYKRQAVALENLRDSESRAAHAEKLQRILKHIPDYTGLQGIETYRLIIPASHAGLSGYQRRHSGTSGLSVSRTYHLGSEALIYNLPTRQTGSDFPRYPHSLQRPTRLSLDTERFDPALTAAKPYAKYWKRLF